MEGPAVPLLLDADATGAACAVLAAAGVRPQPESPDGVVRAVEGGWADVVVLGRVEGWEAVARRVHAAGGVPLLLGDPPTQAEEALLDGVEPEYVLDPLLLAGAVEGARRRLKDLRELVAVGEEAERLHTATQVSRFAQSIALQLDLQQVLSESISRVRELCDADGARLLLRDPESGGLTFDVVSGTGGGRIEKVRLAPGEGIAGEVARLREPLLVEDVRDNAHFDGAIDRLAGFETRSVIAVPLLMGGDVTGVLEAVRGPGRNAFAPHALQRLVELGAHVGIAIHHAQATAKLRDAQAQVLHDNAELEQRIRERTAQIAHAKREWEATFDAIGEPIAVQDDFTVRRTNLAWANRAGAPITQINGRKCHELFAGRDSPCPGCPLVAAREGGELRGEIAAGERTYKVSGFRLDEAAGSRVVLHYEDITRQRLLEHRLRETERLASLGQLASGAAHEINNPMAFLASNLSTLKQNLKELGDAVAGARRAAALLKKGRTAEALQALEAVEDLDDLLVDEGVEMVEESLDGARRVKEIVRALRELSRQQMRSAHSACTRAAVTRTVRSELGPDAARVTLALEAEGEALIDPLELDQALAHLLRNARQAIGAEGRIGVRSRNAGDEILVEIEDDGCGIPAENLHRIFEPFFTTRGVGKGIGLGLTATWGILQRHGGRVDVRSEPGGGSVFTLRLRRAEGNEGATVPDPAGGGPKRGPAADAVIVVEANGAEDEPDDGGVDLDLSGAA